MRPSRPATAILTAARSSQSSCCCSHLHHRPRPFHTSPTHRRRKPAHLSLSHADLQRIAADRASLYQSYTPAEKAELAKKYTPSQLEAIEAGEAAISTSDLATQARTRNDPFQFKYLDDFAKIEPTIDKRASKLSGEGENYEDATDFAYLERPEDKMRRISDILLEPGDEGVDIMADGEEGELRMEPGKDEFAELWQEAITNADSIPINEGLQRAFEDDTENRNIDVDAASEQILADLQRRRELIVPTADTAKQENEKIHETSLTKINAILAGYDNHPDPPDVAPDIPKMHDPNVRWTSAAEDDPAAIDDQSAIAYARLSRQINQPVDEIRRYRVKTLVQHRVVNQTRLGKIPSLYFLCVAGNEKGLVGIGEGKAAEFDQAHLSARLAAIRNMRPIRRYENRTIFGEVEGKCGAVELKLSGRPPGFGIRTSQHIFEIARCAGITDLSARVPRSRNPMNVAKAVWQALLSQKDPEEVARGLGKKLVDVRKVYYAGRV